MFIDTGHSFQRWKARSLLALDDAYVILAMDPKPSFVFPPEGFDHLAFPRIQILLHGFDSRRVLGDQVTFLTQIVFKVVQRVSIILDVDQFPRAVTHRAEPEFMPIKFFVRYAFLDPRQVREQVHAIERARGRAG